MFVNLWLWLVCEMFGVDLLWGIIVDFSGIMVFVLFGCFWNDFVGRLCCSGEVVLCGDWIFG